MRRTKLVLTTLVVMVTALAAFAGPAMADNWRHDCNYYNDCGYNNGDPYYNNGYDNPYYNNGYDNPYYNNGYDNLYGNLTDSILNDVYSSLGNSLGYNDYGNYDGYGYY